jgi:hypothetical protein
MVSLSLKKASLQRRRQQTLARDGCPMWGGHFRVRTLIRCRATHQRVEIVPAARMRLKNRTRRGLNDLSK